MRHVPVVAQPRFAYEDALCLVIRPSMTGWNMTMFNSPSRTAVDRRPHHGSPARKRYRERRRLLEADANAPHVRLADGAVCIGPPPLARVI